MHRPGTATAPAGTPSALTSAASSLANAAAPTLSRRSFVTATAAGIAALAMGGPDLLRADSPLARALGARVALADDNVTLIVKADGDPASFNPNTIADDNFFPIAVNLFHRLVKLDITSQLLPDAATSWDISDDGLTVTFHLRDDLTWTDGKPLTAEDARYTFETIRTTNAFFFCSYLSAVESIEAPDDVTLVFHMASPDISLVTNLGWYANFILPKHVYDVEGVAWGDNEAAQLSNPEKVVSSGPYRLVSFNQGQSIVLQANEGCPDQPAIRDLTFSIISDPTTAIQALLNGEIDAYDGIPSSNVAEVQANPQITVTSQTNPVPLRIIFNMADGRVADPAVRRAIALRVDRADISTKVSGGQMPADFSMYPPVIAWCSNTQDTAPDIDLEAAEQTLVNAGYTKGGEGHYVSGLAIDTFEFSGLPDMAKLIVANMEKVGIGCSVNVLEQNAWSDKCMVRREFSLCMMGGTMGPDPSSLALRYGTDGSSNVGGWSNAEFDDLVAQGNAEGDQDKRAELYRQAQAIMAQELPMVPILDWVAFFGYANRFTDMPCDAKTQAGEGLGDNQYHAARLA